MSACNAQAMSQVGCRLMVASSANTSRPRAPAACGDIARAFATKLAMSSEVEVLVSGSDPRFCVDGTSLALGLVGSPGIGARVAAIVSAAERSQRLMRQRLFRFSLTASGYIGCHRAWVEEGCLHFGLDRLAVIDVAIGQELVQHALD